MKKSLLLLAAFISGAISYAQNTNQNLLSPTGNVGIGTTNPSKKLEVVGEAELKGDVLMLQELTLDKHKINQGPALERVVGIDMAGKLVPMEVSEIIRRHGSPDPVGGLTQNFWSLIGNNNVNSTNFIGSKNNADLIFKTNGTERMRIDGDHLKIGIGTSAPQKALHILTTHTGGTSLPGGGTPHESHYGIRLEDRTTLNVTNQINTVWDIEPFDKNLVFGKPLQPFVTFKDDYTMEVKGSATFEDYIRIGSSSLWLGQNDVFTGNNIWSTGGPLVMQPDGAFKVGIGSGSGTMAGMLNVKGNEGISIKNNTSSTEWISFIRNATGGSRYCVTRNGASPALEIAENGNVCIGSFGAQIPYKLLVQSGDLRVEGITHTDYLGVSTPTPRELVEIYGGSAKVRVGLNDNYVVLGRDWDDGSNMLVSYGGPLHVNPYSENKTIFHGAVHVYDILKAEEILVTTTDWGDDVFEEGYKRLTPKQIAQYIDENGHLNGVPSEKEVIEKGINVAEMSATQMRKIEEAYLLIIDLHKECEALRAEIELLKKQ